MGDQTTDGRCASCRYWLASDDARAAVLRKAATDIDEAAKWLAWALDLLDIYDEGAIKDGHSETVVLTELHIEAKLRARTALAELQGIAP